MLCQTQSWGKVVRAEDTMVLSNATVTGNNNPSIVSKVQKASSVLRTRMPGLHIARTNLNTPHTKRNKQQQQPTNNSKGESLNLQMPSRQLWAIRQETHKHQHQAVKLV